MGNRNLPLWIGGSATERHATLEGLPAADARGKVAYCLTTAQAALAALKLEEGDEKEEQCCVA